MYKRTRRHPSSLSGVLDTIGIAADVASDPYFPELVCRVQQLKAIDHGQPPNSCAYTIDDGSGNGVGLRRGMPGLRAYVYAQENPWVYPLVLAGVVGLPLLIGYTIGKGSKP
jgi:hypothetical protein